MRDRSSHLMRQRAVAIRASLHRDQAGNGGAAGATMFRRLRRFAFAVFAQLFSLRRLRMWPGDRGTPSHAVGHGCRTSVSLRKRSRHRVVERQDRLLAGSDRRYVRRSGRSVPPLSCLPRHLGSRRRFPHENVCVEEPSVAGKHYVPRRPDTHGHLRRRSRHLFP